MRINIKNKITYAFFLTGIFYTSSCKKLVSIPDPANTITTNQVFENPTQANGAMAGIYTRMIHGITPNEAAFAARKTFSAGLISILGGLSSDEFFVYVGAANSSEYAFSTNQLTALNNSETLPLWASAYNIIYSANSVIEGIQASTSDLLKDSVRKTLTGEAKFIRAFCYFYLTNFFGDVPLALTVDFNQTKNMARTSQQEVYQQIVKDLKDAQSSLPADYSASNNERIRANRWAATSLLARVYLYLRDYENAAAEATAIIQNTSLFGLENSLNNVFLTTSREAIWQLQQTTVDGALRNATPEGNVMLPLNLFTGIASYCLSENLLNTFEPGDQRLTDWTDSTDNSITTGTPQGLTYYPHKYKIGEANSVFGAPAMEYYMVFRLAEIYLISAEAQANGAKEGTMGAINDLNMIRVRAGLQALNNNLTQEEVKAAVEKERRTELFAEWGHRWLDLKRTGKASSVLSAIPLKQPWAGDHQLLYPIPVTEIRADPNLTQNIGY